VILFSLISSFVLFIYFIKPKLDELMTKFIGLEPLGYLDLMFLASENIIEGSTCLGVLFTEHFGQSDSSIDSMCKFFTNKLIDSKFHRVKSRLVFKFGTWFF
jgi:hypothetical protein